MGSSNEGITRTYTPSEIAEGIGVSENTIRRAIRKGKLDAKKMPDNKKTYAISLDDLLIYGVTYCKKSMMDQILAFKNQEEARIKEAMSPNDENLPVWMVRKGSRKPYAKFKLVDNPDELKVVPGTRFRFRRISKSKTTASSKVKDSNITNEAQQPRENASSIIKNITENKSHNLIELYNDNDSDLYTLMKGTKLKINLIKKLMDTSNEELEKCKELKEQIPETLSSREKVYEMYDQFIHPIEMRILELKKDLAVETFNLENCRLKDKDHEIEKRIDAEMAISSVDNATDAP